MTHGIDTDFLVAVEIRDHVFHREADALLSALIAERHELALAPQTLAEFIHVATDGHRLKQPLNLREAIERAEFWWNAEEVVRVFPDGQATQDFFAWLREHRLGRKRLLDTLLATTYAVNGIRKIVTNNEADYRVFGCFECVSFRPGTRTAS